MKVENKILEKLVNGKDFQIAGGELVVKTKLFKQVAGVKVYGIVLERNGSEDEPDVCFENIEQLMDFGNFNADGTSLHICSVCGGIPEDTGYYRNNESGEEFCDYSCLIKYLNNTYGIGGWSNMLGFSDCFEVWVKISKETSEDLDNYRKINGEYWRLAEIEYVCRFDQQDTNSCFDNLRLSEIDDVLL